MSERTAYEAMLVVSESAPNSVRGVIHASGTRVWCELALPATA